MQDYDRKVKLHQELVYDEVVHLVLELTFKGSDIIFEWLPTYSCQFTAKKMLIVLERKLLGSQILKLIMMQ